MACFDDNMAVEFIEGSLPEARARDVESHAARCQTCRRLIAELARASGEPDPVFDPAHGDTLPAAGEAHTVLERGDKVDRFVILDRIGSGGMGVVFAAYDPRLDRKVALKLLRSREDSAATPQEAQTRLLREAQAMAQLSHPNVISVYDVRTYRSEVYIAMEFVEGDTLTAWLRKWERPWRDIHDKLMQAARALASAHAAGLVHRDFKPDNVLVGQDQRVRVMDFGLARSLYESAPYGDGAFARPSTDQDAQSALNYTLTKTGSLLGTPRYMAPEQFRGEGPDARSDQFSFCLSFYEALYGYHPFPCGTSKALADGSIDTHRPPPEDSDVPRWLYRVLARGLEREPSRRHPSMDVLLDSAKHPVVRQSRLWVAAAAGLALIVVLLGAYSWHSWREAEQARQAEVRATKLWVESLGTIARMKRAKSTLEAEITELRHKLASSTATARQVSELREQLRLKEQRLAELERRLPRARRPRTAEPRVRWSHGLRIDQVEAAVVPKRNSVGTCFKEWKERWPTRPMRLVVRFGVAPDGSVAWAQSSALGHTEILKQCVRGIIRGIRFPVARALSVIRYTFAVGSAPGSRVAGTGVVEDVRPAATNE